MRDTEDTLCIKISTEKITVSFHTCFLVETSHVCPFHELCKILTEGKPIIRIYIDFVLPLKFRPHTSELILCAGRWLNVIHNINVDVVQDDNLLFCGTRAIIDNGSKDNSSICRRDFHSCLNTQE